jgi:hypothetical protein
MSGFFVNNSGFVSNHEALLGRLVLTLQTRHQVSGRHNSFHRTNALAAAPNVFPSFLRTATKVHFAGVTLRQVLWV